VTIKKITLPPVSIQDAVSKKWPLYVNRFRGKPAITEFDKPFTPNHRSSQSFATLMSSA